MANFPSQNESQKLINLLAGSTSINTSSTHQSAKLEIFIARRRSRIVLSPITTLMDFGVKFDSTLNWINHINFRIKKVGRRTINM